MFKKGFFDECLNDLGGPVASTAANMPESVANPVYLHGLDSYGFGSVVNHFQFSFMLSTLLSGALAITEFTPEFAK